MCEHILNVVLSSLRDKTGYHNQACHTLLFRLLDSESSWAQLCVEVSLDHFRNSEVSAQTEVFRVQLQFLVVVKFHFEENQLTFDHFGDFQKCVVGQQKDQLYDSLSKEVLENTNLKDYAK